MRKKSIFESFPKRKITRKGFLKLCGIGAGSLALNSALAKFAFGQEETSSGRTVKKIKGLHDLVMVKAKTLTRLQSRQWKQWAAWISS